MIVWGRDVSIRRLVIGLLAGISLLGFSAQAAVDVVPPPAGHYAYVQNNRLTIFHNEALIKARKLAPPCIKRGSLYYTDCMPPPPPTPDQVGALLVILIPDREDYRLGLDRTSEPHARLRIEPGQSRTVDLPQRPGCFKLVGENFGYVRLKPYGEFEYNAYEFELPPAELKPTRVPIALSPCRTPFKTPRARGTEFE